MHSVLRKSFLCFNTAFLTKKLSHVASVFLFLLLCIISTAVQAVTYSPVKQKVLGYAGALYQTNKIIYPNATSACLADPKYVQHTYEQGYAYNYKFLYVTALTGDYADSFNCISQLIPTTLTTGNSPSAPFASHSVGRLYENVCKFPFTLSNLSCVFTPMKPPVCPAKTGFPIEIATGKKTLNEQNYLGTFSRPLELTLYYKSTKQSPIVKFLSDEGESVPPSQVQVTSRNKNYELLCVPRDNDPEYATICPVQSYGYNTARATAPGTGWSHSGHRALVVFPDGLSVVVYRPDGEGYYFEFKNNAWTPAFAVGGKLEKLLDGNGALSGWKYTNGNDDIENYDSLGQLQSTIDRNGVSQTYGYDALGRLSTISDSLGHAITLGYDALNRLSTMTDPAGQVDRYAYDAQNNLISLTHADNTVKTYLYEDTRFPNALTAVVDENNNRYMNYHYDAQGRATSEEHSGSINSFQLIFGADGKSTSVTDPLGSIRTMMFTDIFGSLQLTSQTQPSGSGCNASSKSIGYDTNGNATSKTNFNGNVTNYSYDPVRNLETSRTEGVGTANARTITTLWETNFRLPNTIKVFSNATGMGTPLTITTFTYDASGHQLSKTITDPLTNSSRTLTYTYNTLGQVLRFDGPRTDLSDITTYSYYNCTTGYQCGQIQTITNALNQTTQYLNYDANGRVLEILRADGSHQWFTYDLRGRLKTSKLDNDTTTYGYDLAGNLTSVSSPTNSVITYGYDAAHRLTSITNSAGDRIEYTLDNAGNTTALVMRDTSGTLKYQQQKVYDALSRVKQIVDTKNNTTTYLYDANGNPTGVQDAKLQSTSNTYDALDQMKLTTDALSGQTNYSYDAAGRVTQVTDPKNHSTVYNYNAFGDLTSQVSPDTGTTSFTYDAAGNRTSATDARGVVVNYAYDALQRLTAVTYPASASENISFTYDSTANGSYGIGRLASVSTATARNDYEYNHLGLITKKYSLVGATLSTTQYSYDAAGNLTGIIYPTGRSVTYVRDTSGRIQSISTQANLNATAQTVLSGINYLPFGPASSYNYGNGLSHTLSYDNDYRLNSIQVGGVLLRNYGFDAVDNITSITDGLVSTKNQTFNYDALNRITYAKGKYGTLNYTYDSVGNRLTETLGTATSTYNYDTASNRLLGITRASGNRNFTYDLAGNFATGTSDANKAQTFNFNNANRLTSVTVAGAAVGTYTYNALGQRVSKVATSSVSELYHYDEAGQLIAVTDTTGLIKREYIYNGNSLAGFNNVVTTSTAVPAITNFANQATITGSAAIATTQTGFTSPTGYLNFTGEGQVSWPVTINTAATYTTAVRYAMTGTNRAVDVYVDGVKKTSITFTATTDLNTWATKSVSLALTTGAHTIAIKTKGTSAPNIDTLKLSTSTKVITSTPSFYYVHNDHHNAPQVVTNQSGQVVWMMDYQPFGKTTAGQTNSIEIYSRFPGQFYDSETGLYQNYFRDYDPSMGRYLQSDPIGLEGGINTYAYVGGNPVGLIDPYGLEIVYVKDGVQFHANPMPKGGTNYGEHTTQVDGKTAYHVHINDHPNKRWDVTNNNPLDPEENFTKKELKVCKNLSLNEKKYLEKATREVFHHRPERLPRIRARYLTTFGVIFGFLSNTYEETCGADYGNTLEEVCD